MDGYDDIRGKQTMLKRLVMIRALGIRIAQTYDLAIYLITEYVMECKRVKMNDYDELPTVCYFDKNDEIRYYIRGDDIMMSVSFEKICSSIHLMTSIKLTEIKYLTNIILRKNIFDFRVFMIDVYATNVNFIHLKYAYLNGDYPKKQKIKKIKREKF